MSKPIRVLHTADWHLGLTLAGHNRLGEQMERLREMVDLAIDREVDLVLVAGDVYYERLSARMASAITHMMVDALLPLARHGIPVVMLSGNHDHDEWFAMMESLMVLASAQVGQSTPGMGPQTPLVVVRKHTIVRAKGLQLVCLPYPVREVLQARMKYTTENELDPRVARNEAVTRGMMSILHDLVNSKRFRPNTPSILMGHFTTANARTPVQEEGFLHNFSGDFVIAGSDVPNVFAYGALGHIHMPQDLDNTKHGQFPFPCRYSGSPCKLNMGERDDLKSVTLVDIPLEPGQEIRVELVPLKQTEMFAIECTFEELEQYQREADRYKDAYVRLRLHHDGTQADYRLLQAARKLFPKYVGIKLIKPETTILSQKQRTDALSRDEVEETSVEWNPEDYQETVTRYLKELYRDDPRLPALLNLAETLVFDAQREYHGVPDLEPAGANVSADAD